MKIVCVGYFHGAGGAERQLTMLANALAQRGHEVYMISLSEFNVKYDIDGSVTVIDLSSAESGKSNRIFVRYKALKKAYKEIRPDVSIHYWLQSAYFSAFMSGNITGKIIYAERGDPGDKEYSGLLGLVRNLSFRKIDGFVFQSEGARSYFNEKVRERSTVIHNSVNIPDGKFMTPCDEREKKIVSVGRLHPQKNQKLLIEAFSQIAGKLPGYKLEIYGDGELLEQLRKQIENSDLTDRVKIYKSRKDILDCVYTASAFVLTSDYEGMPNALLEAMALGVPCVSTDCKPGGAGELIKDGINGWIVPVNDKNALSEKLLFILSDKQAAENAARQALNIRLTHTDNAVFDKWESFITKL